MCIRNGFLCVVMCFGIFVISAVYAHAPREMTMRYNTEMRTVEADVFHSVGDPSVHHIATVVVKHNDIVVEEITYRAQDDGAMHTIEYEVVEPRKGDVIEFSLECNLGGTLTGEIELTEV